MLVFFSRIIQCLIPFRYHYLIQIARAGEHGVHGVLHGRPAVLLLLLQSPRYRAVSLGVLLDLFFISILLSVFIHLFVLTAFAFKSLRPLLHRLSTSLPKLLCDRCATSSNHYRIAAQMLGNCFVITAQSLCNCFAILSQSFRDRCAIVW
jgi:hypothetical protein